ncbi:MAG: stage II sporulation protein M [Anaerovoracaceae bacterium]
MKKLLDRKTLNHLANSLKPNLPSLLTASFFFIFGISTGTAMEVFLKWDTKKNLFSFLASGFSKDIASTGDLMTVFRISCLQNMGLLILIALSGFTLIGFPLIFVSLAYKGATLGFASTLLMDALGVKGVFLTALTLIPPNIIILPALLLSAVMAIDYSTSLIRWRQGSVIYFIKKNGKNYLTLQLFLLLLTFVGSFIDGFICPFFQRLII